MRILHVVPTYLPATRYGGPIFAVHGLCKALAARGHTVEVFTTNVDGNGTSAVPLGRGVELDGVTIHYFASTIDRIYFSPSMRQALRKRARQFDMIQAHSVFLWPTVLAARNARASGVPYLISPRGMLVPELVRHKSAFAKKTWIRLFEKRNFAGAAAIHFTSERERDDARRLGMAAPRAIVIPNGIDLPPLSNETRQPGLVLFLGRINWKKGLARLIDAVAQVESSHLVIAGSDEDGYAASLPKHERVELIGEVYGRQKEELLQRAAVLVLPSLSENFGNVVLEAMAYGMPVIVTPEVGLAADVEVARAGIVCAGDPDSLAAALRKVLDAGTERETMGRRGRALVEARFTWDRIAAEMENAYACLLPSRR